jgi:hypothetical protein
MQDKILMSLQELLLEREDVLRPFGFLDVLPYYFLVSTTLSDFLKDKELASKIWIPNGPLILKRGSKLEPLLIDEMKTLVEDISFFQERAKHLSEVREAIGNVHIKVWNYFPPRKLADFYYATNREGKNKPIERIFFDIDRGKRMSAEEARLVAYSFLNELEADERFVELVGKFKTFVMWTGNSFHIYVFPARQLPPSFYERYLSYSKTTPSLFNILNTLVKRVREKTGVNVVGGHEKGLDRIVIDPSQTPSGKLARCPFSLHMKDARTVDGVALPLARDMLENKDIVEFLQKQTPKNVVENLEEWKKNLRF